MISLVCPNCNNLLTNNGDILHCNNCDLSCVFNDGVYDFIGQKTYDIENREDQEIKSILNIAKKKGWKEAVIDTHADYPNLKYQILSNDQIDWLFHCIDFTKNNSCLHIGSNLGTITLGLAQYYEEVWSLENHKGRIEFQQCRKKDTSINNINYLRSDYLNLPFPSSSFDLVVIDDMSLALNHNYNYGVTPNILIKFLKEINRIMKYGGCFYWGTDNKLGYRTSLATKHNSAHNYSYWKYKSLLKQSNFNEMNFKWTLSHKHPKYSGNLDTGSYGYYLKYILNTHGIGKFKSLMISALSHLPNYILNFTLKICSPSFLIYAYKGTNKNSLESNILNSQDADNYYLRIGGNYKMNYFLLKEGKSYSVLKFSKFQDSSTRLSYEEKQMSRFNKLHIAKITVDSVDVYIEPRITGVHLDPFNLSHNQKAVNWLIEFQSSTQNGYWDFVDLFNEVQSLLEFLNNLPIDQFLRSQIKEQLKIFLKYLSEVKLPKCSEHGDFWNENIIFGEDQNLYIMDWEYYKTAGNPLFDLLTLILTNTDAINSSQSKNSTDNYFTKCTYPLIKQYSDARSIPYEIIISAVPYVILKYIYQMSEGNQYFRYSTPVLNSLFYLDWLDYSKFKGLS